MFGFSALSETPFSAQPAIDVTAVLTGLSLDIDEGTVTAAAEAVAAVVVAPSNTVLTGQSLDIDEGTVIVSGPANIVVTGVSADIILGQYPVWIPVPVGPSDSWTPVIT